MNNLCPTTKRPSLLDNLPKSQREYTPEQRDAVVKWLSTLSLVKLRKRQDIIRAQMQLPRAQANPELLADMSESYDIESDAIGLREFGEY